ncbi:MAG TPA: glycerol-3-phosphate acyltransferase [Thermoflexia bacterium]|jgi:glycerol-3-phosphate acyltransferase PlsY|nr:glycerol-3-phosphate acyltransferase [Thermoflexia bacterium]
MVEWIGAGVLGYLLGAIPTGVIVVRLARGVDVRQQGSGHTGGLNVSRAAGLWAGVLTGVVDLFLGMGAVIVAVLWTGNPWAAALAGVMAIVGHNWSIFIRFGGGIGLSTLAGSLFGLHPLIALKAGVTAATLWFVLVGLLHVHRARSTIFVMLTVGPLLWAFGAPLPVILLGALGGLVVAVKSIPDWNRTYGQRLQNDEGMV